MAKYIVRECFYCNCSSIYFVVPFSCSKLVGVSCIGYFTNTHIGTERERVREREREREKEREFPLNFDSYIMLTVFSTNITVACER